MDETPNAPGAPARPVATITITFDPSNGQVNVGGDIENKLLSYGLLDLAREAIQDFHVKQFQSRIVPANPGMLHLLGKKL